MIRSTRLGEILLYDLSSIGGKLFGMLKLEALELLPAVIAISSLLAFLFGMDFGGIIKRGFLAVLTIFMFQWFFVGSAELGFKLGDAILSKDNHIIKTFSDSWSIRKQGFITAKKGAQKNSSNLNAYNLPGGMRVTSKKDGLGFNIEKYKDGYFEKLGKDVFGFLIWTVSNFALWFVTASFTLAYYMPLILIPIVAVVNIVPFTSKALEGLFFTAIWVVVTPIVIAILLELINQMLISDDILKNASFLTKSMMNLFFAVYLISSFGLSWKLLGQTGISEGISQVGQSVGSGFVMGAVNWGLGKAKLMSRSMVLSRGGNDSFLRKMAINPLNDTRSKLYQQAGNIHSGAGLTAKETLAGTKPELSRKERMVVGASKVLNPIKSFRDSSDRMKAARIAVTNGDHNKVIDRNETNLMREKVGKPLVGQSGKILKDSKAHITQNHWSNDRIKERMSQRPLSEGDKYRQGYKEVVSGTNKEVIKKSSNPGKEKMNLSNLLKGGPVKRPIRKVKDSKREDQS